METLPPTSLTPLETFTSSCGPEMRKVFGKSPAEGLAQSGLEFSTCPCCQSPQPGDNISHPPAIELSSVFVLPNSHHKASTLNLMIVPPQKAIGCCWGKSFGPTDGCPDKSGYSASLRPQGDLKAWSPCPPTHFLGPLLQPPAQSCPPHSKQVIQPSHKPC